MSIRNTSNRARIIIVALILILGAFWAGARFGPRQPTSVEAVPRSGSFASVSAKDAGLTEDESINVRIYRDVSPAVANILTKATEYDFFMEPVPVEGAGSGFVSILAATFSPTITWSKARSRLKWSWEINPATRRNISGPTSAMTSP